jgi:hypothetical protein
MWFLRQQLGIVPLIWLHSNLKAFATVIFFIACPSTLGTEAYVASYKPELTSQ